MSPTDVETLTYGNGAWKERTCFWGCFAALFGYLSSEGLLEQNQGSWSLSDHLRPSHMYTPPSFSANIWGFAHGLGSSFVPLPWVKDGGEWRTLQFLLWMVCRDEHLSQTAPFQNALTLFLWNCFALCQACPWYTHTPHETLWSPSDLPSSGPLGTFPWNGTSQGMSIEELVNILLKLPIYLLYFKK